jgi:hypothetical protein
VDTSLNENIESEFLKLKGMSNLFPNNHDYVRDYEDFKEKFDQDVHKEVKTKILEIEKDGYYNDHGADHIAMVINRVSMILERLNVTFTKGSEGFYISPYEVYILLMAIQLHDTGHLIASRADHAKKGKELLSKFDKGSKLSAGEKKYIGDIAKSHGGKDNPIGKLPLEDDISHQVIRPQLLAALLRLGDELAEDKTRASQFLLDIGSIEETSIIFHLYSACLDSIVFNGNEVKMTFYIEDKFLKQKYKMKNSSGIHEQYLLDEIYKRTFKTFTESLYCSRFLPEKSRISSVKVNIILLTVSDQDEIKRISYELKENGYPLISSTDIYSMCETLTENGNKLDGDFINSLISEKTEA